ncbi:flagellar export protein FliJ [Martelella lutilitoris]|uniref:Flagellar export protein FliJ n=1 Tax=Martelella lutilitoris TaxID=2583532 RepID=A0A7T7HJB3_9HYPH|nr:flagellar export protein FliJ [Martelella lutilitoris]QQM30205.1 flagellar export protein FliJ [Martelella lutilitoris]
MKARNSLLRLKAFQVKEKKRQLQQLQLMMDEFARMSDELMQQIAAEEKRSGISDPAHFAYSTFAKSARQRADNLAVSVADLRQQQAVAEAELAQMEIDYERAAALELREGPNRKRA